MSATRIALMMRRFAKAVHLGSVPDNPHADAPYGRSYSKGHAAESAF